ncbi:MAG TPA: hypothetical protein PLE19_00765 [Planctomycetota bacterium]|nr:hypothetical protein [Planctomycetota bacterium]HRR79679.1 hypothetical protein [Planctomycetota bacterium]HRT93687.1 hypothetical protein [Planctomycetota bacterium]
MRTDLVLTVAQSKRLIAKGVAKYPPVQDALAHGTVAIAKGGTNAYIVEEILGQPIEKRHYVLGQVLPAGVSRADADLSADLPDVVLVKGQPLAGASATGAVAQMQAGDVFLKGANALNYAAGVAGLLVGHPTGGTMGAVLGTLVARRIRLLIPIGLEKETPADIIEAARTLEEQGGNGPSLWPLHGDLFTEIEALRVLCRVEAVPIGAGGVAGAEGAVWLACFGEAEGIEAVKALADQLKGEPPFAAPSRK